MLERETLILGALLRDVGLFWQGAGIGNERQSPDSAFGDLPAVREKIAAVADLQGVQAIISENPTSDVHKVLVRISQLANHLAFSVQGPLNQDNAPVNWDRPLRSIFAQIYDQESSLTDIHYPTKHLNFDQATVFPQPTVEVDYATLWRDFLKEWEFLPEEDFGTFFEALLYLLKKYTWCVPAFPNHEHRDVALYDHAKVSAALAWCLYQGKEQLEPVERYIFGSGGDGEIPAALLVGGDISGIQSFIYSISSEGVAKSLRGRSVFLNLLCDAVVGYAMQRLEGLPACNLLYSSGGHFFFLAPASWGETMAKAHGEIAERLFAAFGGELHCGLAAVSLSARDLLVGGEALGARRAILRERLGRGKRRQFAELVVERFEDFFEPHGTGDIEQVCAVCHAEISAETRRTTAGQTEEGRPICSLCHSFEQLGDDVRRSQFLVTGAASASAGTQPLTWGRILETLGAAYRFTSSPGEKRESTYVLDDTKFLELGARGFRFVGKAAPHNDKGHVLTFSDLADASQGVARWGLLRMDVDSLGAAFREGLGEKLSLARLSTLSSMLSLFFEGYINVLCKEKAPNKSYVIYAGGDDSFVVGSWDAMAELVWELREKFKQFTCGNPRITLSAALTLEARKYPLYKAADRGAEDLEAAKRLEDPIRQWRKNAFTFLGRSVFWDDFARVIQAKDVLLKLLAGEEGVKGARQLLQKLGAVHALYQENKIRRKTLSLNQEEIDRLIQKDRWRWHLVYTLSQEHKGQSSPAYQSNLKKLQDMILQDRFIDLLDLPVRWAELLTRKKD